MNPKNADYAGDQPQDVGPEQDEKIDKRRKVAATRLGEGDPVLDTRLRPLLEKRVAKK
jgi:hypothetical protein